MHSLSPDISLFLTTIYPHRRFLAIVSRTFHCSIFYWICSSFFSQFFVKSISILVLRETFSPLFQFYSIFLLFLHKAINSLLLKFSLLCLRDAFFAWTVSLFSHALYFCKLTALFSPLSSHWQAKRANASFKTLVHFPHSLSFRFLGLSLLLPFGYFRFHFN